MTEREILCYWVAEVARSIPEAEFREPVIVEGLTTIHVTVGQHSKDFVVSKDHELPSISDPTHEVLPVGSPERVRIYFDQFTKSDNKNVLQGLVDLTEWAKRHGLAGFVLVIENMVGQKKVAVQGSGDSPEYYLGLVKHLIDIVGTPGPLEPTEDGLKSV